MFSLFNKSRKPSVGIVLSGGGARGFAHAGALKAMGEMGIIPDVLAGCSAGSVVAVMYASGVKPENILDLFADRRFNDFCELSVPRNGFFRMDGFRRFLKHAVPFNRLENLPIPTFVAATDIGRGEGVYFNSGPIPERVAASCSMPIIFKPIRIGSRYYVDGGVTHNLPAPAIREQCKVLIGVNCSPMVKATFKNTILDIAHRSYSLMSKSNAVTDSRLCDIVIETKDIADYGVFDLRGIDRVFQTGYDDAVATLTAFGFKAPPGYTPPTKNPTPENPQQP